MDDGTIKEITPDTSATKTLTTSSIGWNKGISQEPKYDEEGNNLLRKNIAELNRIKTLQGPEKTEAMNAYNATSRNLFMRGTRKTSCRLEHPSMKALEIRYFGSRAETRSS